MLHRPTMRGMTLALALERDIGEAARRQQIPIASVS